MREKEETKREMRREGGGGKEVINKLDLEDERAEIGGTYEDALGACLSTDSSVNTFEQQPPKVRAEKREGRKESWRGRGEVSLTSFLPFRSVLDGLLEARNPAILTQRYYELRWRLHFSR